MRLEQPKLILMAGSESFAPLSFVIAERTRREALGRELRDPLPDTVDLAKQPGLLNRLHAILR